MILTVLVALSTLGFAFWIAGYLLEWRGVAVIGATMILGGGAMVAINGLEYKTGETSTVTETNTTTIENDTVVIPEETQVKHQYEQVSTPARLPLGGLIMVAAALMFVRSIYPGDT